MRYRLRTLLIFLAIAPPLMAGAWTAARRIIANYFTAEVIIWEDVAGPGAIEIFSGTLCTLRIEENSDDSDDSAVHKTSD